MSDQIKPTDVHATTEPATATTLGDVHATTEPAKKSKATATILGDVHATTEPTTAKPNDVHATDETA
jgi:hypothetical protein